MIFDGISKVVDSVGDAVEKNTTTGEEALRETTKLSAEDNKADVEQIKLNSFDAQSASKFRSWWRPFMGWSVTSLFIIIILILLSCILIDEHGQKQVDELFLLARLIFESFLAIAGAIGGLRTLEKIKKIF